MSYQSFVYTIISSTTFPTSSGNDSYMMDIPADGCRLGDFVRVSFEANLDGLLLNVYVKSNDMVTVVAHNHKGSTVTLPTANLYLQITKHQ